MAATDSMSRETNSRPRSRLQNLNGNIAQMATTDPPQISPGNRISHNDHLDGPQRNFSTASSPLVNPTSSLLQNLISEQRASRGPRAVSSSDANAESQPQTPNIGSHSEDTSSEKQRKINHALSAGLKQPREMGVREMDQYVSKLNKLNFDLKLEIFHRSQQVSILEKKLRRMEELEARVERMDMLEDELQELQEVEEDNQRLRESNEQLRMDLDKRDQAVNEAVELICRLEARLEKVEPREEEVNDDDEEKRPSTARPDTGDGSLSSPDNGPETLTPRKQMILDVPNRTSSRKATYAANSHKSNSRSGTPTQSSKRPRRHPSFLQEQSSSTSVLRNVYLTDASKSRGASSVISRGGTVLSCEDSQEPESPRLSVLSECSYLDPSLRHSESFDRDVLNINGYAKTSTVETQLGQPNEQRNGAINASNISQIQQWMQPNEKLYADQSLRDFVPNEPVNTQSVNQFNPSATFHNRPSTNYKLDTPTADRHQYNSGRLPPTPDTMSTSVVGGQNKSNTSVIAERSQYDRAAVHRSMSIDRALGRHRSVEDIATRPSTADTILSDGLDTWSDGTQYPFNSNHDYQLASMFPSFSYTRQSSSKLLEADTFRPPNKLGLITSKYDNRISSQKYHNDLRAGKEGRKHTSDSPPLTPQDWLEAALPMSTAKKNPTTPKDEHPAITHKSEQDSKPGHQKNPSTASEKSPATIPGSADADKSQSPLNSTLRSRRARVLADLQPRRRLSLRPPFFNRPANLPTRQEHTPDTQDDEEVLPTNKQNRQSNTYNSNDDSNITTRTISATSKYPTEKDDIDGNERKATLRPTLSSQGGLASGTLTRPCTSNSMEHKRRSSHGFFGWMKGGSGAGTLANKAPETPTSPEEKKIPAPATINIPKSGPQRNSNRPRSALAMTSPDPTASALEPSSASVAEENQDRRPRFPYRRSRRV